MVVDRRRKKKERKGRERRLKELKAQYKALIKNTPKLKEISHGITALEKHETPSLEKAACGDCGVTEGEINEYGCDMEVCPFCGGQLIPCDCHIDEMSYKSFSDIDDGDMDAISENLGVSRTRKL